MAWKLGSAPSALRTSNFILSDCLNIVEAVTAALLAKPDGALGEVGAEVDGQATGTYGIGVEGFVCPLLFGVTARLMAASAMFAHIPMKRSAIEPSFIDMSLL